VRQGHAQCAEILANCGSPINGNIPFSSLFPSPSLTAPLSSCSSSPRSLIKTSIYMLYNPPLSVATKNGRRELASFLLKKGADPNGRDHLGRR
jgi:hypothetical protein